jgi:hypothetical protein
LEGENAGKNAGIWRRKWGDAEGDGCSNCYFSDRFLFVVEELVKGFTMDSINSPGDARRFQALSA